MAQVLNGVPLQLKDGREVDAGEHLKNKEFYDEAQRMGQKMEVVLVSSDYMRFQLQEYYEQHGCTWAVIPLRHPKVKELAAMYKVNELPACRVITEDGTCIVQNARHEVEDYMKRRRNSGELFVQWQQKAAVKC